MRGALSGLPPRFEYKISLGQNFLFDEGLLNRLVEASRVREGDRVLEIGAGRGDLTLALASRGALVTAVEIDERLIPVLNERLRDMSNVDIVAGDIMALDMKALMGHGEPCQVVANLPYYLTTPILLRLLKGNLPIESLNVMVQREAAERLLAGPGSRDYGPLAVLAAYRGKPDIAFEVPAHYFTPPPKVDSVFIAMPFYEIKPNIPHDEGLFFRVVQSAFAMRRKTLANNLAAAFSLSRTLAVEYLDRAGLPESIRGERTTLEEYVALADILAETLGLESPLS